MIKRYKIKFRDPKNDNLPRGWFVYSRTFQKNKNGNISFRRKRISGPFMTKAEARAKVGMMTLKLNGLTGNVKGYPSVCPKTKKRTNKPLCLNCGRKCPWAGRIGRRRKSNKKERAI